MRQIYAAHEGKEMTCKKALTALAHRRTKKKKEIPEQIERFRWNSPPIVETHFLGQTSSTTKSFSFIEIIFMFRIIYGRVSKAKQKN